MSGIEEVLFELYLNYAKRALLGGGKGQYVMEELKQQDRGLYNAVMRRARNELNQANVSRDRQTVRP